jgi:sigma-B regulation protein RsbU (phosphoserine phosphatase)
MLLTGTQPTADDVLRLFHRDAPYLFLGSAFITTGVVAIGLCALRRKFDALLLWMGLFAGLYGVRLWLQADMLRMGPHSIFFHRLPTVINYLIPIPAFAFFRVAGFLGQGQKLFRFTQAIPLVFIGLAVGTLL